MFIAAVAVTADLPFTDWSLPNEFTWNLPDNFCHRLEVSPDHSTGKTAAHSGESQTVLDDKQTGTCFSCALPLLSLRLASDLPDYEDPDEIIKVSSQHPKKINPKNRQQN